MDWRQRSLTNYAIVARQPRLSWGEKRKIHRRQPQRCGLVMSATKKMRQTIHAAQYSMDSKMDLLPHARARDRRNNTHTCTHVHGEKTNHLSLTITEESVGDVLPGAVKTLLWPEYYAQSVLHTTDDQSISNFHLINYTITMAWCLLSLKQFVVVVREGKGRAREKLFRPRKPQTPIFAVGELPKKTMSNLRQCAIIYAQNTIPIWACLPPQPHCSSRCRFFRRMFRVGFPPSFSKELLVRWTGTMKMTVMNDCHWSVLRKCVFFAW